MKKVGFNDQMIDTLSSMIGKTLKEIKYDEDNCTGFGNVALIVDEQILEISNREDMDGFDEEYESSHFACSYVEEFIPVVNNADIKTMTINEVVQDINIVNDLIDIDSQDYHIDYDMAIEIVTDQHKYVISRGYYYSEIITISVDKEMDEIYPVSKVIEDWQDDDTPLEVKVNRIKNNIKERKNNN